MTTAAIFTSRFFPRNLRKFISSYMKYEMPNLGDNGSFNEEIIKYCQYISAREECEDNARAFPIYRYAEIRTSINSKLSTLKKQNELNGIYNSMKEYAESIRLLKHVRRWNRFNRNIPSSVMAHTFVVSMLTCFLRN